MGGGCGGESTGVGAGWWGQAAAASVSDRRHLLARALYGDWRAVVRDVIRRRDGDVGRFMLVPGSQMHTPTVILWGKVFWRVPWLELGRHGGMRSTRSHRHREIVRDRRGCACIWPGERRTVSVCVNVGGMAGRIKCGKCVGGVPRARLELSAGDGETGGGVACAADIVTTFRGGLAKFGRTGQFPGRQAGGNHFAYCMRARVRVRIGQQWPVGACLPLY